jgi:hypothetical protein
VTNSIAIVPTVTIVLDPADPTAAAPAASWAAGQLHDALSRRGLSVGRAEQLQAGTTGHVVLAAGPESREAREVLASVGASVPTAAESLALAEGVIGGQRVTLATGSDVRGLVYAILELADRVEYATGPVAGAFRFERPIVEQPANPIRSIARLFTSDVEDKAWYNDQEFWSDYLTELATHRYNRFTLTLGLGYNFPRHVPDAYFYFSYPFLLDVPGYDVRATNLPDAERDQNLAMLQFIGAEVKKRGLHFQLALWTHAYEWIDSPNANHSIEGLNAENHAAYSRDALRLLLEKVPTIDGLTFRIHGESGVPEGSWDFWKTLFDGAVQSGRRVEIDMHAKGMDQETIDVALATGLPVNISPKYWAEHQGLPYHQTSIRPLEHPEGRRMLGLDRSVDTGGGQVQETGAQGAAAGDRSSVARRPSPTSGYMGVSGGSRRHTRYGYTDLLQEDRQYGVFYRIWPGTQRLLLWGDPAMAAGYGRYAHFAGCLGVELCEPLSFKGRIGSGLPGGRHGYADESLVPEGGPTADWTKYRYTYRVWGRLTYSPATDPDGWRRYLRREFGAAAEAAEAALANASRILLLITTAYHPSASNNRYWPEIYTNMPIVSAERPHPYGDTPDPKRFGTVTSLDPELIAGVDDYAADVLSENSTGKYSPLDVARWLDRFAEDAASALSRWREAAPQSSNAEARRWHADIAIQAAIGRFFAAKLRAGVAYALYSGTGSKDSLREALDYYRTARAAWAEAAGHGRVYRQDLTFGREPWLRGHWLDRLPAIDQDIADMEALVGQSPPAVGERRGSAPSIRSLEQRAAPDLPTVPISHTPPSTYRRGSPVSIDLSMPEQDQDRVSVTLHYRHVNQAELYETVKMENKGGIFHATIAGEYAGSPYPLEYFFRLRGAEGHTWHYPPFDDTLANQPYFLLRQR